MIHDLNIEPNYLDNLLSGKKKVELRFNDRDYQKGDTLLFKKYGFTEVSKHEFEITHIHSGLGMREGYVALSVSEVNTPNQEEEA